MNRDTMAVALALAGLMAANVAWGLGGGPQVVGENLVVNGGFEEGGVRRSRWSMRARLTASAAA